MRIKSLLLQAILPVSGMIVTPPAAAQKAQTIETAHEFLEKTSVPPLGFDYTVDFPKRQNRTVVAFRRSENCRSEVVGELDYEALYAGWSSYQRVRGPLEKPFIDWKLARGIEQRGFEVGVNWGSESYWFRYPSVDLAARAAFAMEFLRVACDPTADLAF